VPIFPNTTNGAETSDNGKHIYDSKGLFFNIILTAKNEVYEIPRGDGITVKITDKAVEVVTGEHTCQRYR
jgi:hypothetical protein